MPNRNKQLAASLTVLHQLQTAGRHVFQSKDLSRVHRQRLLQSGFIQLVMKGWLISSSPAARDGDSTPWYASFWEFCAQYCEARFGDQWYLAPEESLLLHAENTVIPNQVTICSPKGTNNKTDLLFGTSIYDLKQPEMPPSAELIQRHGLRFLTHPAALVRISGDFYARNPIETRVALTNVRDESEVLRHLLDGGHSVIAGRLAGAFRTIGRPNIADEITVTMKAAGHVVRETDPFTKDQLRGNISANEAPIVGRMRAMWSSMREQVIETFPTPPAAITDSEKYLRSVDEIYRSDAYHSLSIEGYRVSPELIAQVESGNWNPDHNGEHKQSRDALAARGYWQAFQVVKSSVAKILAGANAGALLKSAHREWYRELFQPCVMAGLVPPSALAGYRNNAVYLRTSRYVPPRWEAVRDAMPALFDLLENEPEASVRAVLGHWMFGYIHPYPDGNGRIARFLMNAMLASGGYPWTVIRVDERVPYLTALDRASIDLQIAPFAAFIGERVGRAEQAFTV